MDTSLDMPSIAQLLKDLSNPIDPGARRQALLQLSSIGPAASEALDAIRERLKDENAGVRYVAVIAFWRVSRDPQVVLPELPTMMEDESVGVRSESAAILEAIGRPATGVAIKLLHSDSPLVRSQALLVLRRIVCPETFPEVSDAIASLCEDPDPGVRTEALVACVDWGINDKSAIRLLLRTDRTVRGIPPAIDKVRNSREVALQEITWLGPDAADLVPDVITLLEEFPALLNPGLPTASNHSEAGVNVQYPTLAPGVNSILRTLSSLKIVARPAVPCLLERLKEFDQGYHLVVIGTLANIGADPEVLTSLSTSVSTPGLVAQLTPSPAEYAHYKAQQAGKLLAREDPAEARRQVSLLIPKLADPRKPIDRVALYALQGLAREAHEAVPLLISLLSERGPEAAYYATEALAELGPEAAPAVPRLVQILEHARADGKLSSHSVTFKALGSIGPAAESAVPRLLALLNDSGNTTYHEYAMSALEKIAPQTPEVQSAIRRQLSSGWAERRSAAMHALARSAKDSPLVLAEIIDILKHDSVRNVRAHAALAIAAMSGDRRQAIGPLTEALGDSDLNVRKMAAIALRSIGPVAKSALPALRQAWSEARCGILGPPRFELDPRAEPFRYPREMYQLNELPLAQALRRALREIDRPE